MRHLLNRLLLLVATSLLSHRASSQAVLPLRAVVVRLDSGVIAHQTYICMDSTTYRQTRQTVNAVPGLRQRVALLEYDRQLLEQQVAAARREGRSAHADFTAATAQARQLEALPVRPPLLLDSRVYTSAGAGIVATFLYFLLHP